MATRSDVGLRPYSDCDFGLLRELLGDPDLMRYLGGPESEQSLIARHARYLGAEAETNGIFVIVVGEPESPAGWVGFWESQWAGEVMWECGWHVLPGFQGAGVATAGASLALREARDRRRHRYMEAFPASGNAASNALCKRLGFVRLADVEIEYPRGSTMQAVRWRLDLGRVCDP